MIENFVSSIQASPDAPIACHCACNGISRETYYQWRDRAANEPDSIYVRFVSAVDMAMGLAWRTLHQRAATAKPEQVLFRRHAEDYPSETRLQMELSGVGGGPISVAIAPIEIQLSRGGEDTPTAFPTRDERTERPAPVLPEPEPDIDDNGRLGHVLKIQR